MNLTRLAVIALVLLSSLARAEDWTVQGKTYKNVTVEKSDAEYVHIMYDGGIGRLPLSSLPSDLQKKFNYDPKAAAVASQQEQQHLAAVDQQNHQAAAQAQNSAGQSAKAEAIKANPWWICGTVMSSNKDGYTVTVDNDDQMNAYNHVRIYPPQANDKGEIPYELRKNLVSAGTWFVYSQQQIADNAPISLLVYQAGTVPNGNERPMTAFADDAAVAAAHQ